jgi:uncharacterized DUF497 family protein
VSPRTVRFDWDAANLGHIARHDVSAKEVQEAILDRFCLLASSEVRQGQLRYNLTGATRDGRILTVIFEIRQGSIRTVTSFTAPKKKQSAYWTRRNHVSTTFLP